jgi:hypothetical protein
MCPQLPAAEMNMVAPREARNATIKYWMQICEDKPNGR